MCSTNDSVTRLLNSPPASRKKTAAWPSPSPEKWLDNLKKVDLAVLEAVKQGLSRNEIQRSGNYKATTLKAAWNRLRNAGLVKDA